VSTAFDSGGFSYGSCDFGGNVLLLGRQRRRDARRAAADNDDFAPGIHPPPPFCALRELLTRPRHCA
jgi:hypothetical protein